LVDGVRQKDEYDSADTSPSVDDAFRICCRLVDNTDDDEKRSHKQWSDPKGWSSTPSLRDKEYVGAACDEFLSAEKTGDEEILRT
jgi:hypothetical protein